MFWARFLCRICANIGTTAYPIFEKSSNRNIESKIKRCLNLNIFEDDFKPKMVCDLCYTKLNEIYDFVEMCHASNNKFELTLYQTGRSTTQVMNNSWHERPSNGEINMVEDNSCAIMGPKQDCPDFLSIIDYHNKDTMILETHHVENHSYGPKPYVPTKHVYEQQTYEQKYSESTTVLRHSSQFQNRPKHYEENEVIHSNVILPGEYEIPVDRPINYVYHCKAPEGFENNVPTITHEIPIAEDLIQHSHTFINDYSRKDMQNLDSADIKNLSTNIHNQNITQTQNVIQQEITPALTPYVPSTPQHSKPPKKKINLISVQTIINMMKETEKTPAVINENNDIKNIKTEYIKKPIEVTEVPDVKPPNKRFTCTECSKNFTRKYNLTAHMSKHTNKRNHICEVCEKSFAMRSDLLAHRRLHLGIYECHFCAKSFTVPSKLQRHVRIHTNTRPFVCKVDGCDKAFSDKRNLDGHKSVHLEDRKFICDTCKKSYKTKNQLTDHYRIHNNEFPFKCKICFKSYRWKNNLVMHMKKHNGYSCLKCKKDCGKLSKLIKHRKECQIKIEGVG